MSYLSDILEVLSGPLLSTASRAEREAGFTLAELNRALDLLPKGPTLALQIVPDTFRRQFRFPRSKKKRLRKKWAQNPANFRGFDCGLPADALLHDRSQHVLYLRESLYLRLCRELPFLDSLPRACQPPFFHTALPVLEPLSLSPAPWNRCFTWHRPAGFHHLPITYVGD